MDHLSGISILFLPIAIVSSSQFWDDVDSLHNKLLGPRDLPTQATTNEAQPVEISPPAPHHAPSTNESDENKLKHRRQLVRRYYTRNVTLGAAEVENFQQTVIIDKSYPQNVPITEIEKKLLALESVNAWYDLDTYDIDKYSNYWTKVCLSMWGKPVVRNLRYFCSISVSYGMRKMRTLTIRRKKRFFDLLYCKCHNYRRTYRVPLSTPEIFLIHKTGQSEFFIFEQYVTDDNVIYLNIKGLKGGITLPKPLDEEQSRIKSSKSLDKSVTLRPADIKIFNQSLIIDRSYPENISLAELEDKLLRFEDFHYWPDLHTRSLDTYAAYWANLCVLLWGKQLDQTHRQACVISTSYGANKIRKLFLSGRILYFDLLDCKCHSYTTNYKKPLFAAETFLVHQSSENEFFVFEQHATAECKLTLFIKYYKRVINLPGPEAFK